MISYAQNLEDVLLNRAFGQQASGFYIDIGACHPTNDSVTRHFYERGWRGVNVEPGGYFANLASDRRRDVNLNVAVSSAIGELTYYEFPGTGLSTLSSAEVSARAREGLVPTQRQVAVTTLRAICETHVTGDIDFISIDVEGHEREVIAGGDWQRWRPRVAVIESTRPNSTVPSHESWEPLLLSAGYHFATFDGINRFYVRDEDLPFVQELRRPITVLDEVVPYKHLAEVRRLQSQIAGLEDTLHDVTAEMQDFKQSNSLRYWMVWAAVRTRHWLWRAVAANPTSLGAEERASRAAETVELARSRL